LQEEILSFNYINQHTIYIHFIIFNDNNFYYFLYIDLENSPLEIAHRFQMFHHLIGLITSDKFQEISHSFRFI